MKRRFVIHPFLFGLFFVLALYSANVDEVSFSQVLVPSLVVVGGTVVILLLSWILLKNIMKAALLTSVAVILSLSYGHVMNLLERQPRTGYNFFTPISGLAIVILMAWGAVFAIAVYFFRWYWKKRWSRNLGKFTILLNVVGAVLIVMPLITIVVAEAGGSDGHVVSPDMGELDLSVPETPPDIYYIILDRYASSAVLEEKLGFDNGEFLSYLSGKGFIVAGDSRANYLSTQHSLASSLDMNYLDSLAAEVGETARDLSPLYEMLQDYRVWRLLETAGYQFIHVGSWWEPTRENRYADVNINYGETLPEFSRLLLKTTAFDPAGRIMGLWGDERWTQYQRVKYEFDRLGEIPEVEGPTFVFAHFLTPHPDYVFKRDGEYLPFKEAVNIPAERRYLDQLIATNQLVEACIDRLIEESDTPPIIILQSDEGPYADFVDGFSWTETEGSDVDLRAKSGILNAYYLPGVDSTVLYSSITPVNSFRVLFNLYFGTSLELLPDRYYYWHPGQPYRFIDLTDRLQGMGG